MKGTALQCNWQLFRIHSSNRRTILAAECNRRLRDVTSVTRKTISPKVLVLSALLTLPAPAWTAPVAEQKLAAALGTKADLQHGAILFKACVTCHNSDGSGEFNGDVPAIAGQYQRVLLRQLIDFRYGKRWDVRMEAIASSHYLSGA